MSASLGPPLEVTVATVATQPGGLSLAQETRLVKAALLYADHVTLASVMATFVGGFMAIQQAGADATKAATLRALGALGKSDAYLEEIERMRRKRHKLPQEIIELAKFDRLLARVAQQFGESLSKVVQAADPSELDLAARRGVLTLEPLGLDNNEASVELITQRFFDVLAGTVRAGSTTYPMLDDSTSGLMRAMLSEGVVSEVDLVPARQAGLAGHFIQTLEAFPDASMDVVLDAREELRKPLGRFRAAVIELAASVETSPFEPAFPETAKNLYRQHVVPALAELEETARQLNVKEALRRQVARGRGLRPATAALALGFSAVTQLPDVATAAVTSALAAGAAGSAVLDIAKGSMEQRQELLEQRDKNKFLFLFQADRALSRRI